MPSMPNSALIADYIHPWKLVTFAGNDMLRAEQWPTSLCLWLICGFLWLPQMDLISIGRLIRHGVQKTRTEP